MGFSVPRLSNGDVADANTFNTCLSYIEGALNSLSSAASGVTNRSALMMYDVPVETTVQAGDLVYYNKNTGVYDQAKAALKAIPGANGESLDEPTAFVQGMVTQKSGNLATLWVGGCLQSQTLADACLGAGALDGIYYLSTTPGKASMTDIISTRQPVLTYTGEGRMTFMLFYMAHDGHFHKSFTLSTNNWESAASYDVKPVGAAYRYAIEDDVNLNGIGLSADTACVFYEGLLDTTHFIIEYGTIWSTINPSSAPILFTNYPFVAAGSIVRGIYNDDDMLAITNQNGVIKINLAPWTVGTTEKSSTAVASFDGTTLKMTPVVSDITPLSGISITDIGNGVKGVAVSNLFGSLVDAETVEMSGALRTTDGTVPYFQFPGTNTTSMVICNYLRGIPSNQQVSVKPWVINTTGSGTINTTTYFIPDPVNGATSMSTGTNSSISTTNGSLSATRYAEASTGTTCTGPGMILTVMSSSSNIRMLRIGHKYTAVE